MSFMTQPDGVGVVIVSTKTDGVVEYWLLSLLTAGGAVGISVVVAAVVVGGGGGSDGDTAAAAAVSTRCVDLRASYARKVHLNLHARIS